MFKKENINSYTTGILHSDEISVIIPLVAIMIITTLMRPDFFTVSNFSAMFTQIPFIAIVALGTSFPLMTGKVDISTGRVAGFAGILMSMLAIDYNCSAGTAIIVSIFVCALIGIFNGILVVHFEIPDFVATMATLYIVGGLRYMLIKGYQFSLTSLENFTLVNIFDNRYFKMPIYFWITIILYIFAYVVIKKTIWGRHILASGDNSEVALLAGINVKKIQIRAYMISSVLSAIAGILLTLDVGIGLPETGDGWEFRAIAGAVIGGVSLSGGKCSPFSILLGVTLVFMAENAIIFMGLPTTMRVAVQGALMAGAVLFDIYKQKRKIPA